MALKASTSNKLPGRTSAAVKTSPARNMNMAKSGEHCYRGKEVSMPMSSYKKASKS